MLSDLRGMRQLVGEQLLFLQLLAAALLMRIEMRHTGLRRLVTMKPECRWMSHRGPADEKRLVALVDRASRATLGRRRCLVRALLLCRLLKSAGRAPVLNLGIAKQDGRFLSHAWVSVEGRALGERGDIEQRFRTITSIMAA